MNVRSSWRVAVASIALAGAVGLLTMQAVQAADTKAPQLSDAIRKPILDVQKALQEKRYQDAIPKLKEADAYAKKTPYDQHVINYFSYNAYFGSGDKTTAMSYMDAVVSDSDTFTQPEDKQRLLKNLAILNYQMGKEDPARYDKAIDYGNRAISAGDSSDDLKAVVGSAYYLKSDYPGTRKFEEEWAQAKATKGEKPDEQQLQIWKSACVKLNDHDCLTRSLQTVVTYYPEPKNWEEAIGEIQRTPSISNRAQLHLYRLALEVKASLRAGEYTDAANLALEQGSPGEAQWIVQKGLDGGAYDARQKENAQKLLDSAKRRAAADRATLAEQEKDAAKVASGQPSAALGYAYFGYQQYDKAAEQLSAGLGKGGLKDTAGSRLLLGISQLKSGHKDEALQSFQSVKGDPVLEKVASLWVVHAKQPAGTS